MSAEPSSELPVKLTTKDEKTIMVSRKFTEHSGCLRKMLEICGTQDNAEFVGPVRVEVNAHIMKRVISWCENYERLEPLCPKSPASSVYIGTGFGFKSPRREEDNKEKSQLQEYNDKFLNALDQTELFELTRAADFLEIIELLELATKKIATLIVGKSPAEVRQFFRIENDFSPEENLEIAKPRGLFDGL